jgi:hypothetical protein
VNYLFVGIGIACFIYVIKSSKSKRSSKNNLQKLLPSRNRKAISSGWGIRAYQRLDKLPLIGGIQESVFERLKLSSVGEEAEVVDKTGRYTTSTLGVSVSLIILSYLIATSVQSFLTMGLAGLYAGVIVFDLMITREENSSLAQLVPSFNYLKDDFTSTKMVVKSLNSAADRSKEIASVQLRQIARAVGKPFPEREMIKYYATAPNEYLRKVAGASLNVILYQDGVEDNGASTYVTTINHAIEDLMLDIGNRNRLFFETAGFKFIAVVPVFLIEPVKYFFGKSMPAIASYYDSFLCLIATAIVFAILATSFIGTQMSQNMSSGSRALRNEGRYLQSILSKSTFIRRRIERLAPSKGDSVRAKKIKAKTELMFKDANSSLTIPQFFLRKCIVSLVTFIFVLTVCFSGDLLTKVNLLDKGADKLKATTTQEYLDKEKRVFDAAIVEKYQSTDLSREQLLKKLEEDSMGKSFVRADGDADKYLEGLADKVSKYNSSTFKWYYILIALLLAFLAFDIPDILLDARGNMRKQEMQREVDGLYSSCMNYTKGPRAMTLGVLNEMYRYSSIFAPQLQLAIIRYRRSPQNALTQLKEDCRFDPMTQLVDRLQASVFKSTPRKAFADLEVNRQASIEGRKLAFQKSLESRVEVSKILGMAPTIAILIAYLLLPLIIYMLPMFKGMLGLGDQIIGGG